MSKHRLVIGVLVMGVLVVGWYLFRPELLFVNTTVSEALPDTSVTSSAAPGTPQTVLATGHFHSVSHASTGVATIHQFPTGTRLVRLTAFETSNGPDVHVYLIAAPDAQDNDTVTRAGFVDLGALKGNTGDQNYEVPAEVDLRQYHAVTIWCRRFGVNFATAPLRPEKNISS